MSTPLTFITQPTSGDTGATFWTQLEQLFQKWDDHRHTGSDSEQLAITSIAMTTQSILAGAWVSQGGGTYKQTVTLPGTLQFDSINMEIRTSAGVKIYPSIIKITSNTYDIYVNDNTLILTALYGT